MRATHPMCHVPALTTTSQPRPCRRCSTSLSLPLLLSLLLLLLALTASPAAGQTLQRPPVNDADIKKADETLSWGLGRVTGISKAPVITNLMSKVSGASDAFVALNNFKQDAVSERNCALNDQNEWFKGLDSFSALRGWPLVDKSCVSSTKGRASDRRKYTADEVLAIVRSINRAIGDVKDGIVADTVGNFSDPQVPASWKYSEGKYKRCVVEKAFGVRYRPANTQTAQWYFTAGITNGGMTVNFPDWDRQFVTEFVGVDSSGKFLTPLAMSLIPWPGVGKEDSLTNTTAREAFATSYDKWRRQVGLSTMLDMRVEDVPALQVAVEIAETDADQAIDATTPSNVAILALPMVLSVIPLSLLAEVGTIGLLVYTLLTDILTTVPFIIKGVELYKAGTRSHAADVTNFAGEKDGDWIIAETWAADCRLEGVRSIGIAFMCIGFAFLVVGLLAEFQARILRKRWSANGTLGVPKHDHLKAALLQRDLREKHGLSPEKPSNPDVLDEEAQFLLNQNPPPAVAAGPGMGLPRQSDSTSMSMDATEPGDAHFP